ncbi:MAG: class I adenylate cyclase [Desulfarculaceae bacterium]|nr:class I adenylate cyclase [Desulfarculaceae bacterium]
MKTDPPPAHSASAGIKKTWEKLEHKERENAISQAGSLDPADAVVLIIKGISSYHFALRNRARRALGELTVKLSDDFAAAHDKKTYLDLIEQSDAFCARIYREMVSGALESDFPLYFKALLESKGRGPFYAWKLLCRGHLSARNFLSLLETFSEEEKLSLVLQYIDASPSVRRRWAVVCKKIIAGIESRRAVIALFADLFDKGREPDPVLYTLKVVKNPERLLYEHLYSPEPQKRGEALKAASYILQKLDPSFLANTLRTETDKNIRITALKIIENSTAGTYASIWPDILKLVYTGSREEALSAFRAIVVADDGDLPGLLESIHLNRNELMNDILQEIAGFSRIAFFFIQDIAFNRKKYSRIRIGVHRACILGITAKRPERVLNVLKGFRNHADDELRMNINNFYEKVGRYLAEEREDIGTTPLVPVENTRQSHKSKKKFFRNLLSPPLEKRLAVLKEETGRNRYDFDREHIEAMDLSGISPTGAVIFFTECRILDSDFSRSRMYGVCFENCILHDVNFKKVSFDRVSFENSILVNVDAAGSSMVRCNFKNTRIHNCDFSRADITDSFFTGASIAKTSFARADITGASFVLTDLSLVSFADSWAEFSDFTAVSARFSRFADFTELLLRTEYADFNARSFQLVPDDIPDFDEAVISSIEMLIFIEFIHYGRKMFVKKNKLSHLIALDVFARKQADFFEIIPLMLHENIDIPGYGTIDKNCPKGIAEYLPESETGRLARKYMDKKQVRLRRHPGAYIEGLFTIGSTGSIAQAADSDIDYWVCIREEFFSAEQKDLFQKKLDLFARWAGKEFRMEVNFFIVDVNKALHNEFGELTFESSGSAQARILKEEFYRTMIRLAGKIPLWCVLPVPVGKNYYSRINSLVKGSLPTSRYINLGDLHGISPGEYFGASIWQMYKLLNSPFKSVIKMGLLEKFINEYGTDPLLCNRVKDLWMKAGTHMMIYRSDPYYTLLRDLMDYYRKEGDRETTTLIQVCYFLKMKFKRESDIRNTLFGLRAILIERCMKDWGMKMDDVLDIGGVEDWEYTRTVELSSKIKRYMIGKTRVINKSFRNSFQKHSKITPEERTALVRKIVVEFGRKKGKIEKTLLLSRKDRHFQRLSLKYAGPDHPGGAWALVSKSSGGGLGEDEPIKSAGRIETISAWLVNNSFAADDTVINLVPNPTYVTIDDVNNLLIRMNRFFQPILQQPVDFSTLLGDPVIVAAFVSLNLYAPSNCLSVQHYCVVYVNSWGEMFTESVNGKGNSLSGGDEVRRSICSLLDLPRLPENTYFYLPRSFSGKIDI